MAVTDVAVVDVVDLPPLTGSPELDPWRIRYRLELAGELRPSQGWHREGPTPSELMLWAALQAEAPGWSREYTTGPYRLDFYCPVARLAVEVDGGSHFGRDAGQRDALRDEWHRAKGITTMRVSADHVERDVAGLLEEIRRRVRSLLGEPEREADRPAGAAADAGTRDGAQHTNDLEVIADQMLGEAAALRDKLQSDVDRLRAQGSGEVSGLDLHLDVDETVGEPDLVTAAVAQIQMAMLQVAVGGSVAAAERKTERLIAAACRTVLPEQQDGLAEQILRRAGLPVVKRTLTRRQ